MKNKNSFKIICWLLLFYLTPVPSPQHPTPFAVAHAIEIPLDGFGKTVILAYVNMFKVFEAFPETEKARIELNQMIAEKKQDITLKKEEISGLKAEINFLKRQMGAVSPSTATRTVLDPTISQDLESEPDGVTRLTLPEDSPLNFLFSPPKDSTTTVDIENEVKYSTFSKQAPQILPGVPSPGPSLVEKETELINKVSELEVFIGTAEQEIRYAEEGKTMTLMARIYRTLEEMSKKQGYSIVMDKTNVLYGEETIDITDQLIQRLRSPKVRSNK